LKATLILRPGGKDALQIIFRSSIGSFGKRGNTLAPISWYAGFMSALVRPAKSPKDQACLTTAIVTLAWLVFAIAISLLYDQRMSECNRVEKTPTLLGVEVHSEKLNSHRSQSFYTKLWGVPLFLLCSGQWDTLTMKLLRGCEMEGLKAPAKTLAFASLTYDINPLGEGTPSPHVTCLQSHVI